MKVKNLTTAKLRPLSIMLTNIVSLFSVYIHQLSFVLNVEHRVFGAQSAMVIPSLNHLVLLPDISGSLFSTKLNGILILILALPATPATQIINNNEDIEQYSHYFKGSDYCFAI